MDVPRHAPTTVPIASASSACFARGIVPFWTSPMRDATPMSVPDGIEQRQKKEHEDRVDESGPERADDVELHECRRKR